MDNRTAIEVLGHGHEMEMDDGFGFEELVYWWLWMVDALNTPRRIFLIGFFTASIFWIWLLNRVDVERSSISNTNVEVQKCREQLEKSLEEIKRLREEQGEFNLRVDRVTEDQEEWNRKVSELSESNKRNEEKMMVELDNFLKDFGKCQQNKIKHRRCASF